MEWLITKVRDKQRGNRPHPISLPRGETRDASRARIRPREALTSISTSPRLTCQPPPPALSPSRRRFPAALPRPPRPHMMGVLSPHQAVPLHFQPRFPRECPEWAWDSVTPLLETWLMAGMKTQPRCPVPVESWGGEWKSRVASTLTAAEFSEEKIPGNIRSGEIHTLVSSAPFRRVNL